MSAFIDSIVAARTEAADDAAALSECAAKLQEHNRSLKEYIAKLDAESVKEAMAGFGCDDKKLIVALCSRTKSQLKRTAAKYRELYDEDLREAVRGETSGDYGKLVDLSLAPKDVYFADMIDKACVGIGCSETTLIELFVTTKNADIAAGRKAWEGRTDKNLIDYLDDELTESYKHLQHLIFKILKGERDESGEVDEAAAVKQVEAIHKECDKGMFSDFKEQVCIEIIGGNCTEQNLLIAEMYENKYDKSMAKALTRSPKEKLVFALQSLIVPKATFIASRLEAAMKGWGTDEAVLIRLLAGLDGDDMAELCTTFESKYGRPLAAALKDELSGDFKRAALMWIRALQDPSEGLEALTESDAAAVAEDAEKAGLMLDALLQEYSSLRSAVAAIDAERLAEACIGFGTNDKLLIGTLTSRSKTHLGMVSQIYYAEHEKYLVNLIGSECSGWYGYLAKFIVLSEEDSDLRLLDLAMDGLGTDEMALIEFLCARPPARVRKAKATWEARHDKSLIDRLNDELSGDFRRLCLTLLKGDRFLQEDNRSVEDCNMEAATEAATHLYNKGEGQWGTCEEAFIELLCACSPVQNKAIALAYENKYDKSLAGAIKSEFSSVFEPHLRVALLALLMDPYDWYAYRLKKAFKGWGTDDRTMCRILGCADKKDALKIAEAWQRKYGKPLRAMIKSECSGDYKRLAIAWVTVPDELEAPNEPIELPDNDEDDGVELIEDEEEEAEPEPEVQKVEEPTEKDDPEAPSPGNSGGGQAPSGNYPTYPSPYRIPGANLPTGHPALYGLFWALHKEYLDVKDGARAGLPPGWEQRVDLRDRRVYFADHKTRTTTWAVKPSWAVSKSLAAWWEQFDKASLTAAGTSPEAFEEWFPQIENQVRALAWNTGSRRVHIFWLRKQWGV